MATELEAFWQSGGERGPGDTHLTGRDPWYAVHRTRDGGAVAVGAVEPPFHAALCAAIGHPELAAAQHAGDGTAWPAFRRFFAEPRDEAMAAIGDADACASPVLSTREVAASPLMDRAVRAGTAPGERLVHSPVRLPGPPLGAERSGGRVLVRFGFTDAETEALIRAGVVSDG